MLTKVSYCAAAFASLSSAADVADWKSRAIYHMITDRFYPLPEVMGQCKDLEDYCGGTFKGMESKLDYIAGMGFDAISISPVIDNGPKGYHGMFPKDWTKLNANFGTDEDLNSLVKAAHDKGMYV